MQTLATAALRFSKSQLEKRLQSNSLPRDPTTDLEVEIALKTMVNGLRKKFIEEFEKKVAEYKKKDADEVKFWDEALACFKWSVDSALRLEDYSEKMPQTCDERLIKIVGLVEGIKNGQSGFAECIEEASRDADHQENRSETIPENELNDELRELYTAARMALL